MKELTGEQKLKFKELYMKGYSAPMIFKELGQDYGIKTWNANSRMRSYRIRLGLPKRGIGFKPTVKATHINVLAKKAQESAKRKKRINQIENAIIRYTKQIEKWKEELNDLTFRETEGRKRK